MSNARMHGGAGGVLGKVEVGQTATGPEEPGFEGEPKRRGRGAMAAVLLLLLLLCSITTITESFIRKGGDTAVRGVVRNLECLQCHVELIPDFSRASVHSPFKLEHCTTCHTPHGEIRTLTVYEGAVQAWNRMRTLVEWLPLKVVLDAFDTGESGTAEGGGGAVKSHTETQVAEQESYLTAPANELCWMCHGNLGPQLSLEYPHEPFARGQCVSCHNPHASNVERLLVVDQRDLCVMCHRMKDELALDQVHPPFGQLDCGNCHDPHASRYRGILVNSQRELCFACHPSVARMSALSVQHDPFMYDNCTGCHRPHSSDYRPLVIQDQPKLCYRCHPAIEQDFRKVSHHPVGTLLDCTGCHQPHASGYQGLLPATGNQICYTCHAEIKPRYARSDHGDARCWSCHQPHGSDSGPLLNNYQPDVCFSCHERQCYDDGYGGYWNHPVRSIYYDVNRDTPLTCTTSCHDPHGTRNNYMLRAYNYPFDGNCLMCHARVPGVKVGVDY